MTASALETLAATRVLSGGRRGSSRPVVAETAAGPRLVKLRGAAQGAGALIAEVVVAVLAEVLGLRVPARALVVFPPAIPSDDPDDELADLLSRSVGLNLGFVLLAFSQQQRIRVDEKGVVRVCPYCEEHPPYLRGALQCVDCGRIRPRRQSFVTWHSCVKGASEPAQDALDLEFHSASAHGLNAHVDIECHFLGTYPIVQLRLSAPEGVSLPSGDDATALVIERFARHGLIATRV